MCYRRVGEKRVRPHDASVWTWCNTTNSFAAGKNHGGQEFWAKKKPSQPTLTSLVISPAGAGTITDVLYASKALIVVSNPNLMGDHQNEIANRLHTCAQMFSSDFSTHP